MLAKTIKRSLRYLNLPLLCAVLLEAHIRFLSLQGNSGSLYLQIMLQLILESLPFFIAHHFAGNRPRNHAIIIWFLGFICYPLLSLVISAQNMTFEHWSLLSSQGWLFVVLASTACFINHASTMREKTRVMQWISKLFSLNMVIAMLLVGWATVMAGVFNSTQDPKDNQSQKVIIDLSNIVTEFGQFFEYFWQFLIVASLFGSVFAINRYGLIRQVLAKQGILAFVAAALICIIIVTPIFASLVLWLPLNTPDIILFPSSFHHVFAPANYQFIFSLLAISTPLILVFERQQQNAVVTQISFQKTHTELKLLQQQINPHFLFNTLNNLYALILTKSDDAPSLVVKLSNLLRYTVYEGQKEQVTLAQEVTYLQDYIALEQIRSLDKCTLDLKWPENAEQFTLPPLLIIMLIENAFKYGVEPTIEKSHIRFHMQLNKNILTVICENPIFTHKHNKASGLGLENLSRRLTLLYPGKHTISSGPIGELWCAKMTLDLTSC
ncbi:two-component system, LytT family, sensor kinase [Pseudoalteromonas tunicata]|uniref:Putative two-component system sensor protein, no kinase domain n=2 Tax=Pseudoalteromonas tunicata TaxID=314281 RepID=A4C5W9_9GAMM|nr:two-component system, LytT family, sensor kinase [Pseudoalteromonas tunicata]AXT30938.1 histidine kinase [Pseudoalteromonas tunicata]EAR29373.1 putative two-component system sensor protein, no kinase domain [Pseudoalteromonas tunicata D2]